MPPGPSWGMAAARPFSLTEQAQFLGALTSSRDRLLCLAGIFLGFRISELLGLKISDVWTEGQGARREVTVATKALKGGRGINRQKVRSRTVPVHPVLQAALQDHIQRTYAGRSPVLADFLFPSSGKGAIAISRVQAHRIIKAAARRSCDPSRISTHSLRKSFARAIYDLSGHDLLLTQRALGHRAVDTTTKYLESTSDSVKAVILKMAGPTAILAAESAVPEPAFPDKALLRLACR